MSVLQSTTLWGSPAAAGMEPPTPDTCEWEASWGESRGSDGFRWPAQLQDATAAFVREIEDKWGRQLPEGRNPDIKFMAHVWEDLRVLPKPLALHAGCEVISLLGHAMLRYMGFRMENCQVCSPPLSQALTAGGLDKSQVCQAAVLHPWSQTAILMRHIALCCMSFRVMG